MGYSNCREGSKILISQSRDMRNPVIGFITRVWDTGVDAVGFPGGKVVYYSGIWSHDDPRFEEIGEHEAKAREERGVFAVADYHEEDIRRLERIVEELWNEVQSVSKALLEHVSRLDILERAMFGVEEEAPGGKG